VENKLPFPDKKKMMEEFQPERGSGDLPGPSNRSKEKERERIPETVVLMDAPVPDNTTHLFPGMMNQRYQEPLPFEDASADIVGEMKVKTAAMAKQLGSGFWGSLQYYLAGMIADPMSILFGTAESAATGGKGSAPTATGNPNRQTAGRARQRQHAQYQFDLHAMCAVSQRNRDEMRAILALPKRDKNYKLSAMHISVFKLSRSKFEALDKLWVSNSQEFANSALYVNMAMSALGTIGILSALPVTQEDVDNTADTFEENMSESRAIAERVAQAFTNIVGEKDNEVTIDDLRNEFLVMDALDAEPAERIEERAPPPPPPQTVRKAAKQKAPPAKPPAPKPQVVDVDSMFIQVDSIQDNVVRMKREPPPSLAPMGASLAPMSASLAPMGAPSASLGSRETGRSEKRPSAPEMLEMLPSYFSRESKGSAVAQKMSQAEVAIEVPPNAVAPPPAAPKIAFKFKKQMNPAV